MNLKEKDSKLKTVTEAFSNQNFNENGKLGIQYVKEDQLKALVHHGAHSQSLHQMLK